MNIKIYKVRRRTFNVHPRSRQSEVHSNETKKRPKVDGYISLATHNIYRNIKIPTTRVIAVCESGEREWETVFLKETANRERERERERKREREKERKRELKRCRQDYPLRELKHDIEWFAITRVNVQAGFHVINPWGHSGERATNHRAGQKQETAGQ
jgi:hypothetical protein